MKNLCKSFILALLFVSNLFSVSFPDKGGLLNFDEPENISDQLFILTNPKSGSHLLLYSIMKMTKRPLRGRVPLWHFLNDPPFFPPENIMDYELDFSKPTIYWGHEYHLLSKLNRNNNKLIFVMRDYKENIASNLILKYELGSHEKSLLGEYLRKEILEEGMIFKEFILRLKLFDRWDPDNRLLVQFKDLVAYPENFVPKVLKFMGEEIDCAEFINDYQSFKKELRICYDLKENNTGSGESLHYFSDSVNLEILKEIDDYVAKSYPKLWKKYLKKSSRSR